MHTEVNRKSLPGSLSRCIKGEVAVNRGLKRFILPMAQKSSYLEDSKALHLIQQVRDDRFAIHFKHRAKRDKRRSTSSFRSNSADLNARDLLTHFVIQGVKASEKELTMGLGGDDGKNDL